jgi:hypothetical protein
MRSSPSRYQAVIPPYAASGRPGSPEVADPIEIGGSRRSMCAMLLDCDYSGLRLFIFRNLKFTGVDKLNAKTRKVILLNVKKTGRIH